MVETPGGVVDQGAIYAADLASRKAFRLPSGWDERKRLGFQHRLCSTSGCTSRADWMIARSSFDRGAVRYACDPCKAKKYSKLEEAAI